MAIRRSGRLPPSPILMSSTSRSLQKSAYSAMPTRSYASLYPGRSRASSVLHDTRAQDYYLFDRVSDVSFLSNATLDESDDTVRRSRGRDQKLLRDATSAIVSSESYATPQTSVAARRVVRGRSLAPRAASVPPRPYYPDQVDSGLYIEESTTKAADYRSPYYEPYFQRPVVVYAAPPYARRQADRAKSVPPFVLLRDQVRPGYLQPATGDWRARIRAKSVPPAVLASVLEPELVRRQYGYYRGLYRPRPHYYPEQVYLPTAGLTASRVPRFFLTREPIRTGVNRLWGYYGRREAEEPVRYRRTVNRARVLATPVYRAPVARGRGRYALPYYSLPVLPKPKVAPLRESLSGFPQVFVPRKGRGPSNRSKAAIIASKMEPDPLKRRRPRSEYAARKYRQLRQESKDSIYSGLPSSGGLHATVPPARKYY